MYNNPSNPSIPCLQINIPPLKIRIADLTDKLGVVYLIFYSHVPSISD